MKGGEGSKSIIMVLNNANLKHLQPDVHHYRELLEQGENIVIDSISETMDLYGVTPSIGRLYGILYFSDLPLTLDEMSQKTGMSKPSMCTGIHSLVEISMVQKVWKKGVRKDQYEAEKNFFQSFLFFFCKKWDREIALNLKSIESAEEIFDSLIQNPNSPRSIKTKAKKNLQQLQESKQYYEWLQKLVNAFKSKEILNIIN